MRCVPLKLTLLSAFTHLETAGVVQCGGARRVRYRRQAPGCGLGGGEATLRLSKAVAKRPDCGVLGLDASEGQEEMSCRGPFHVCRYTFSGQARGAAPEARKGARDGGEGARVLPVRALFSPWHRLATTVQARHLAQA